MILTEKEVLQLVKEPIDPIIAFNKKIQDDHKVHIQGTGFESVLKQIIGYENVEQFKTKKLITRPFTRSIFKKIKNAQGRWKTAWGTSRYYIFKNNDEEKQKEFKEQILSRVWKNQDILKFTKEFLANAIYEEFNGFILIEKGRIEVIDGIRYEVREGIKRKLKENEELKPYIVFKSVNEIYKFKLTGKTVEFIVLKHGKIKRNGNDIELFRVIDDAFDYIVEKQGDKVKISEEQGYTKIANKIGRVPASCITYINKTLTDDKTKTSPVDEIIDLLDNYLQEFGEHLVTKILHAHPKFFQTGQKCSEVVEGIKCDNGRIQGSYNGKDINKECPNCKGSGHNLKFDASTILILPAFDREGKPFSINNVAGYVTPPVDILTFQQQAIEWMEEKILESATGINNFSHTEGLEKTATGVIANIKPLEDIISEIIDIIEGVEKDVTDIIGKMYYGDSFIESEIIYGRKLSLRDENTLITEIRATKEAGASLSHIKALNEELTYSRFNKSNSDFQRNKILNELEPLIGFTYTEIEGSDNITKEVKFLKQNFNELIQKFEIDVSTIDKFKPNLEFGKRVEEIRVKLMQYVDEMINQEEKITISEES